MVIKVYIATSSGSTSVSDRGECRAVAVRDVQPSAASSETLATHAVRQCPPTPLPLPPSLSPSLPSFNFSHAFRGEVLMHLSAGLQQRFLNSQLICAAETRLTNGPVCVHEESYLLPSEPSLQPRGPPASYFIVEKDDGVAILGGPSLCSVWELSVVDLWGICMH